jgi:hypothetical protein
VVLQFSQNSLSSLRDVGTVPHSRFAGGGGDSERDEAPRFCDLEGLASSRGCSMEGGTWLSEGACLEDGLGLPEGSPVDACMGGVVNKMKSSDS